jgi:hypothetical protein
MDRHPRHVDRLVYLALPDSSSAGFIAIECNIINPVLDLQHRFSWIRYRLSRTVHAMKNSCGHILLTHEFRCGLAQ